MMRVAKKVALRYLLRTAQHQITGMKRIAGEVRFIKDKSGDASEWAYSNAPPLEREINTTDYNYDPRHVKKLARCLRATTAALGHTMSAYHDFAKIKSAQVSPDGSLGGKGYIQKIADMRRQYMNVVEALSSLSDTLFDEVNAPHWAALSRQEDDADREEVLEMIQDTNEIREDPEGWAEQDMNESFGDDTDPEDEE